MFLTLFLKCWYHFNMCSAFESNPKPVINLNCPRFISRNCLNFTFTVGFGKCDISIR
jgi:hypothetical protein